MLPVRVKADIGAARAALEKAREIVGAPRGLLEIAGGILEESTRDRFRAQAGPGGIPWPTTARQRFAAQPQAGRVGPSQGGRALIDKGGLLSSITHVADESRVEVGVIAKTRSAKFAAVHQFGAVILPKRGPFLVFRGAGGHLIFARKVTIPARPFIGIDANDRADLMEAWGDYLKGIGA